MNDLYRFVSDNGIAEILTLITFGLICLGYLSFIWSNSKRLNIRLSTFDWAQIYFFGLLVFLTAVILLGKLIVPNNADDLLELIGLEKVLRYATLRFQWFWQNIIRMMM